MSAWTACDVAELRDLEAAFAKVGEQVPASHPDGGLLATNSSPRPKP